MVNIPKSIKVMTGEQGSVYSVIGDFFIQIKNYLEPESISRPTQCKVEVLGMYLQSSEQATPTDNISHILFYRQKVAAIVLETRDDFNEVQFDFFMNDLEEILRDSY